jgi:hypothetical protein
MWTGMLDTSKHKQEHHKNLSYPFHYLYFTEEREDNRGKHIWHERFRQNVTKDKEQKTEQ